MAMTPHDGPLKKNGADFFPEVREFEVNPA
jgi:hypothetical protein